MGSGCGRDILFHKWRVCVCPSVPLIRTGGSSDPFPSKTAADKDKMHLENKATKPELFEASEADKGNCKANKEMFFFSDFSCIQTPLMPQPGCCRFTTKYSPKIIMHQLSKPF